VADWTQFEGLKGAGAAGPLTCEACEAMCLDAVDETLSAAELAVFERHVAGCVNCAQQLAEARRGAAWMQMLKVQRPEPSADLLARILAQTSGAAASNVLPMRAAAEQISARTVVPVRGKLLAFGSRLAAQARMYTGPSSSEMRLMMTAAMAFFSIALTLSLSGIRPGDLRVSSLHRTVAEAQANVTRSFQNNRVVYQVESRVMELRNDDPDPSGPFARPDAAPKQAAPAAAPEEKPADKPATPNGTSELKLAAPHFQRVLKQKDEQQIASGADAPRMREGA
jgi:hypothetical protein